MEIDTLFGLPAHPLVVHAAVVLLPIAAIALVVVAAIPRSRRVYGPIVLGVAIAATIAVGLAQGSGESLEDSVQETELVEEHTEQGETVLPWAIGVTVVSALVAAEPYTRKRLDSLSPRLPRIVTAVLVGCVVDRRRRCHLDRDRSRPLRCDLRLERRHRRRLIHDRRPPDPGTPMSESSTDGGLAHHQPTTDEPLRKFLDDDHASKRLWALTLRAVTAVR